MTQWSLSYFVIMQSKDEAQEGLEEARILGQDKAKDMEDQGQKKERVAEEQGEKTVQVRGPIAWHYLNAYMGEGAYSFVCSICM